MDFSEILRIASENQGCKDRELPEKKGINTNLGKAKRKVQDKKEKGVKSAAVLAFLKKQEDDEKKQAEEAKKKKENLMKLREEKNTVGKLRNIIKRNHTKEAIFQVEGTDKKGESQTTPESPHADQQVNGKIEYTKLKCQYGGKERRALFQNVVRKPVSAHWEPKAEDEAGSGATSKEDEGRVKKQSDGPTVKNSTSDHGGDSGKKSKSSSKHSKSHSSHHKVESNNSKYAEALEKEKKAKEEEAKKKKKKKPQGPPPMSFDEILKLAQQKKEGPEKALGKKGGPDKKDPEGKKPKLPDRPMTKDEKERWERVHSKQYQDWIKHGKQRPEFCINTKRKKGKGGSPANKNGVSAISDEFVVESDVETSDEDTNHSTDSAKISHKDGKQSQSSNQTSVVQRGVSASSGSSVGRGSKEALAKTHQVKGKPSSSVQKEGQSRPSSGNPKTLKLKGGPELVNNDSRAKAGGAINSKKQGSNVVPKSAPNGKGSSIKQTSASQQRPGGGGGGGGAVKNGKKYNEVHENVLVCGSSGKPNSEKNRAPKQEQLNAWDRVYGQFQKKKSDKKRRVIESESDYSDEDGDLEGFVVDEDEDDMDDFIDDSGPMDYSKHIRDIFGYDKKKYRYIDEEDSDDMEAGFNEIEQEEEHSARVGMAEDMEDMKMEEAHKKRKMAMKKMAAKKSKYR